MNRKEVLKFIAENQHEHLIDYYNKCYEKLRELNQKIDKLTLYLIVIVFLYFISSSTTISSIQIGPASISDISLLLKIIPVLFAFVLFQIIVISSQKSELFTVVKMLFLANYKQDIDVEQLSNNNNNLFTRLLLPFSYTVELTKFSNRKGNFLNSFVGALLALPLLALLFLPIYFEFYMLKVIWNNYYEEFLGKASFWLSSWLIFYLFFYIISNAIQNLKDSEDEVV